MEDKSKQTDKVSSIPKDLFTQYHPQISKLSFILNKHKRILKELSNCFPDPPRVFFRRKRNLKDILCKSDIFSNSVKEETERNQPCNHGNCKLCSSIAASNKITNKQNKKKFEIKHGGTCQTKNIIYAAECRKHKKLYIGQSKCQLNKRFCGHRFDIKKISTQPLYKDVGGTELSEHFSTSPHSQNDLRVRILDNNPRWGNIDRWTMEDFYMCKLKTIEPDRLNVRHGIFAKLFYNQF